MSLTSRSGQKQTSTSLNKTQRKLINCKVEWLFTWFPLFFSPFITPLPTVHSPITQRRNTVTQLAFTTNPEKCIETENKTRQLCSSRSLFCTRATLSQLVKATLCSILFFQCDALLRLKALVTRLAIHKQNAVTSSDQC